jgi:haloalkane dehalogenase
MQQLPRDLYPFDGKYFDLDGLRMHYLDEGEGTPVVMVHGNPTWSFFFRDLVRDLRVDHRAIVPDHIGCGFSDKPGDADYDYRLRRRVADFSAFMDGLDVDTIDLVIHDWGGVIAMGWAVLHPERIRRLVILNTGVFPLPGPKKVPWQLALARTFIGALLVQGLNAFVRVANRLCVTKPMPREVRQGYCAPYDSWANRIATLRFVQDAPATPADSSYEPLTEIADKLEVFSEHPILICWGDEDFVFDDHFLSRWREIYPHAEVHQFADAGHYLLEDAGDRIIPLVREFLDRE